MRHSRWRLRVLVSAAFILQLTGRDQSEFSSPFQTFWALSILPFSALFFLVYTLLWLFNNSLWPRIRRGAI